MRCVTNPTALHPNAGGPSRGQTAPSSPIGSDAGSLWIKEKEKERERENTNEKLVIDTQKPLPLQSSTCSS